jgi:3-oxoacyl-[acyl-carrier-protein] synthase II
MNERKRVFVTGFGTVSTLGNGESKGEFDVPAAALSAAVRATTEGVHRMVGDFGPEQIIGESALRRMDRFTQMAMVATHRALKQARLEITPERAPRIGLIFNTCFGPFHSTRKYIIKVIRDGAKRASAAVFPNTVHNAFTGLITMDLKALGSNSTVSGYNAVCYGLDLIRNGYDDAVIVGGCDELIEPIVAAFETGQEGPHGKVLLGEGAAVLVLESEAFARERQASLLAEILDYGMASSPSVKEGAFECDPQTLAFAMRQALQTSGIAIADIGGLVATANGLAGLERSEREAIRSLFGAEDAIPVEHLKGAIGETLGAAAPFNSVFGVTRTADAERDGQARAVMVNNVELGGTVTSLILGPAEAARAC